MNISICECLLRSKLLFSYISRIRTLEYFFVFSTISTFLVWN